MATKEQQELCDATRKIVDYCIQKRMALPLPSPQFFGEAASLRADGSVNHKDVIFVINIERVRLYFEQYPEVKVQMLEVFDNNIGIFN